MTDQHKAGELRGKEQAKTDFEALHPGTVGVPLPVPKKCGNIAGVVPLSTRVSATWEMKVRNSEAPATLRELDAPQFAGSV